MKTSGTYIVKDDYTLEVNYDYYWMNGDHSTPPEDELEVTSATLNGMDITNFYMEFLETTIMSQLYEHAQENK